MHLILLAAGKGSRLPYKYRKNPKCLARVNGKSILEHNLNFYKKFKYKTIIVGYRNKKLKSFNNKNRFCPVVNRQYKRTNMVYSLFKTSKIKSDYVVICYSDIIFDKDIYENISSKKKNTIVLKKNWLKVWKGRMKYKEIIKDAEDVKVKNNKIISIGEKIKKRLPKYQYMGIVKMHKEKFFKLKKFFKKNNNYKIDLTSFLNLVIKKKLMSFNAIITNKFWYEIDTLRDIKFTEKNLLKKLN
jgi:choline kinase